MKKTLRLLLFEDCNRSCEGCCNKQWDLSKLPVVSDFTPYDEIILTGGEPMLKPEIVFRTIRMIRNQNISARIILYTAMTDKANTLLFILENLDGLTITLHDEQDILPYIAFRMLIDRYRFNNAKSLRLNVFSGVDARRYANEDWQIKDNIEWLEDCPLPDNEVFMRL